MESREKKDSQRLLQPAEEKKIQDIKILLVDDESSVRFVTARGLRNAGYIVQEAASGPEALSILADSKENFDLLITDVTMPQMTGLELAEQISHAYPELRILCMSGYAEEIFREKASLGQDMNFIAKPFTSKQLIQKLEALVKKEQAL